MAKVIIPAIVLLFAVGCSTRPQPTPQEAQPSRTVIIPAQPEMTEDIRHIAWKAYVQATGLNILAEESPVIVSEFTLFRDVQGLGKKGDKIHEVRFVILGSSQITGLILVNEKTKESLVVFPKKKDSTEQKNSPDRK